MRRCPVLVLVTVAALAAACGATTPTPSGVQPAGPTVPAATAAPTPDPVGSPGTTPGGTPAVPAAPATPSATAATTPIPVLTPAPGKPGPRWETAKVPRWVKGGQPVLLADGRVLLLANGGSAAVWNPATGRWKATASLNKPRSDFAAIRLADGRVLVAGGTNPDRQSYSSAYTWDPATGEWTKTGLMTQARTDPSIAALPDGRILVAGGYFAIEQDWGLSRSPDIAWTGPERSAQVVPATLAAFRAPFADVEVPPYGNALATAEILDPATGEWSKARPMRFARAGAPAVTLDDGRVLVAGAAPHEIDVDWRSYDTGEVYDPASGRWTLVDETDWIPWRVLRDAGVPDWVRDSATGGDGLGPGTLVALDGGDAVVIGRSEWAKHEGEETRSFRFEADRGTWREIGTPWLATWENQKPYRSYTSPGPRWLGASVVRLDDGRVLVAGGETTGMEVEGGPSRAVRLYDPATDSWARLPRLPQATAGPAVRLADGSVVILGGSTLLRFVPGR